jgi:Domain of unknown function (DUF4190)
MSYVPPAPPGATPQWGPPPGTGAYTPPRIEGTAIAALICSIGSWLLCPMILAVVALALAHAAGNKIDASDGRVAGEGLVRAAQIIAWIHIALVTLVCVIIAIVLIAND